MRITAGVTIVVMAALIALWSQIPASTPAKPRTLDGQISTPVVSPISPPIATDTSVQWVQITTPGAGAMIAAIARPQGPGPFPAVIILHGSHGFAQEYVRLARDLAREGILAVAACWFSGGQGAGVRFVTPIPCPAGSPIPSASSDTTLRTVNALVRAVRTLPGVQSSHLALLGHSRGGGAALQYVLAGGIVQAIVLNSAGYPPNLANNVSRLTVPILMLHGRANSPEDGGSPLSSVEMARGFEASLRAAHKTVEAVYYEGDHSAIFTNPAQYEDEVRQIAAFLRRFLFN
jgi:dienelactone hydrolase